MTEETLKIKKGGKFLTSTLILVTLSSALAVIFNIHWGRQLFTQLQSAQQQIESLQLEWSQLLLEQGTWSADARVAGVARKELQMILPDPSEVVIIRKKTNVDATASLPVEKDVEIDKQSSTTNID